METALDKQREFARANMETWCKEFLSNPRYVATPPELLEILLNRLWDLYCKATEPCTRWNTTHGPTWWKHDGDLIRYLETYSDYSIVWQPLVNRYNELNAQNNNNIQATHKQMLKEFLKSNK